MKVEVMPTNTPSRKSMDGWNVSGQTVYAPTRRVKMLYGMSFTNQISGWALMKASTLAVLQAIPESIPTRPP